MTGFKTEILGLCGSVGGDEFDWVGNGSDDPLSSMVNVYRAEGIYCSDIYIRNFYLFINFRILYGKVFFGKMLIKMNCSSI